MIDVRTVAEVRAAEETAFAVTAEGTLMQRAATGLAVTVTSLLGQATGSVVGSRVLLLVGSGNNGGDALWAGAMLAQRGCRVDALTLGQRWHQQGAAALLRAGGRLWSFGDADLAELVASADVVIDGILGIGGNGGLRDDAAVLVEEVASSEALVVAVDIPSGIDADTGTVAGAAVHADVTVTFGALKPGLVVAPGSLHCGATVLVDIGLEFTDEPAVRIIEALDVAGYVPEPAADAYKYRRGVVGVSAGSGAYPGAALLASGSARRANVGMPRFLDRSDGVSATVVTQFPDIVVDGTAPSAQSRIDAWACGPGFPGDQDDDVTVSAVLVSPVPVILDAGALSVVARSGEVRDAILKRSGSGRPTVLTPHEGEFERIWPGLLASSTGRLEAATKAAQDVAAIVVLKGPGTVVAAPDGSAFVDTEGTSDLGTAGSGDVLTGLVAGLLAGAWADGRRAMDDALEAVASAVWLHGRAGRIAAHGGPVVATDLIDALPEAIRVARFGDDAEYGR